MNFRRNVQWPGAITREPGSAVAATPMRLRGAVLALARGVWIVGVVLALGLFVVSIPTYFSFLHLVCIPIQCKLGIQLSVQDVQFLQSIGISLNTYALLQVLFNLLFVGICVTIGLVIFWRKSTDVMGLLSSFVLVVTGITLKQNVLSTLAPSWNTLVGFIPLFGNISGVCLGYVFPGGTFAPRWMRWLFLALIPYLIVDAFLPAFSSTPLAFVIFSGVLVSMLLVQVYRYRSISTTIERQQTKWVVFGAVITLGCYATGLMLLFLLLPHFYHLSPLIYVLGESLISCFQLAFPLAFSFAILRYRLYDIDIIINRTVVYGLLTSNLVLVYAGLIVLSQLFLSALTRQITLASQISQSPLVIVCSTLAVAALFRPLRHGIQKGIDRRFYRSKYDAVRTLNAFTATLHHEVDLWQLSEQLLAVVQETMQPAHISLWLRPLKFEKRSEMARESLHAFFNNDPTGKLSELFPAPPST